MREDLNENCIQMLTEHCKDASIDAVVSHYAGDKYYDWQGLAHQAASVLGEFELLATSDVEANLDWIVSASEKLQPSPQMLDSLDTFSALNCWRKKYHVDLVSMVLAIDFSLKMYPEISQEEQHTLLATLVYKDIGYARLSPNIPEFEILNPLVSYKMANEANKEEPRLSEEVIDAILKHHEFIDQSGPLASRKHPQVLSEDTSFSVPIVAQISGLCDIFVQMLMKEGSAAVAYALLIGLISPVGKLQGKYDEQLIGRFKTYYRDTIFPGIQIDEVLLESKLSDLTAVVMKAFTQRGGVDKKTIYNMVYSESIGNTEDRVVKLLSILKLLSMNNNSMAKVLYDKFCPCPTEYQSA